MGIPNEHHVSLDWATIDAGIVRGKIARSRAVHAAFAALGRAVRRALAGLAPRSRREAACEGCPA